MPEKKIIKTDKDKPASADMPAAVYFKSLTIRDVKCFRGEHTIDLSDGEGRPAQWTVILGNNNTGKTTILKCLAGMEAHRIIEAPNEYSYCPMTLHRDIEDMENSRVSIGSELYLSDNNSIKVITEIVSEWYYEYDFEGGSSSYEQDKFYENLVIESYGASRKMVNNGVSSTLDKEARHTNLFEHDDLMNVEDWIFQLDIAINKGSELLRNRAINILSKIKEVLTSGILPDVKDVSVKLFEYGQSFAQFLEFKTDFGQIRLRDLGYGYQTMLAWVLDLVRRMFERYPDSPNPIKEPAIVLVDEIDLHLHPEWQRKIIAHLTKYFPNTQFIVTAHSPLVVQSAEKINLVLLEKDGDHVNIVQPKIPSYQGWTLEEILSDVMGLSDRTHSDVYLALLDKFEKAVDAEDHENAQAAHDELVKIVHPSSHVPKLLRLRMSSLMPA